MKIHYSLFKFFFVERCIELELLLRIELQTQINHIFFSPLQEEERLEHAFFQFHRRKNNENKMCQRDIVEDGFCFEHLSESHNKNKMQLLE